MTGKRSATRNAPLLAKFEKLGRRLAGEGPEWMRRVRRDGLVRFSELGFPTSRLEEWKTTNVARLAATPFSPAADAATFSGGLHPAAEVDMGGPRLIFVNGRFDEKRSRVPASPNGLWIGSLAQALEQIPERIEAHLGRDGGGAGAFAALNAAFAEDGGVVLVGAGQRLELPVQLVYVSTGDAEPTASHPRTLVVVEDGGSAEIVETYVGTGNAAYLTNSVTDVEVGNGARAEHYRVLLEGDEAFHISTCRSRQARDSAYTQHAVNLGGKLVRHDIVSVLDGEGAESQLHGLVLTGDEQHVDNHTVLDHASPHGDSRELYKCILADRSRAVFNGRIIVRPGAQKTDAKQSNRNLLLSRQALANTRPQLEIYADDVKCTHGATIGRVDNEAVFYLRSRGIPDAEAHKLLISAFANEVLERIRLDPLRERLEQEVARRLERALAAREAQDG